MVEFFCLNNYIATKLYYRARHEQNLFPGSLYKQQIGTGNKFTLKMDKIKKH